MTNDEIELSGPNKVTSYGESYWKQERILDKKENTEQFKFKITKPDDISKLKLTVVATLTAEE